MPVGAPELAEYGEGGGGQDDEAVLGAFAVTDMDVGAFGIDVADVEVEGFTEPETEAVGDEPEAPIVEAPEVTIRRRFSRGIANFFFLYSPIAAEWSVLDNSATTVPRPVASGTRDSVVEVADPAKRLAFREAAGVKH